MNERALLEQLQIQPCTLDQLAIRTGLDASVMLSMLNGLQSAGIALEVSADARWHLLKPVDALNRDRIAAQMCEAAALGLGSLELHWCVDSTNAQVLRSKGSDGVHVDVLLAEGQTQGRGQRGRQWISPLCSHLYMSLGCPFGNGLAAMSGLSIAVGVMVTDALESLGLPGIGLKWPNDVMTPQGKLGGILVETAGPAKGPSRAVIGIGLNVHATAHRDSLGLIDQPWDWVDRLSGRCWARDDIAIALINSLIPGLQLFREKGLAPFLARYAQRDVLANRPVCVEDGAGMQYPATAVGIADDGGLRLRQGTRESVFHAGQVRVRMQ